MLVHVRFIEWNFFNPKWPKMDYGVDVLLSGVGGSYAHDEVGPDAAEPTVNDIIRRFPRPLIRCILQHWMPIFNHDPHYIYISLLEIAIIYGFEDLVRYLFPPLRNGNGESQQIRPQSNASPTFSGTGKCCSLL